MEGFVTISLNKIPYTCVKNKKRATNCMLLSITEIRVLLKYQVLEEKKPTSWARQKCHDFYPPWNFKKGIHGTASIVGQLKLQANEQGILKTVSNC